MIDRGPFHKGYAWDLTKKIAKRLGFLAVGAGPHRGDGHAVRHARPVGSAISR